jgi:hypothetical protein
MMEPQAIIKAKLRRVLEGKTMAELLDEPQATAPWWEDQVEYNGSMGPGFYGCQPFYIDANGDKHIVTAAYLNKLEDKAALADELVAAWRPIQYIDTDSKLGRDWFARYEALKEIDA